MADLTTHISTSAVFSGLVASAYLGSGIATPREALAFWVAGSLGGILPDVDADHSTAVNSIFTALGVMMGFLVMVSRAERYSILEMWIVYALVFAVVRYLMLRVVSRFTRHRGALHSIVAGVFFCMLFTVLAWRVFRAGSAFSWTFGTFVLAGFLVHLILDEVSSVDLTNVRIKGSFGTALKLVDLDYPKASMLLLLAAVGLFLAAPELPSLSTLLFNGGSYKALVENFLPAGTWFH